MGIYRVNLVYYDSGSGMGWSINNHWLQEDDDKAAIFNFADLFNTQYMVHCAETVGPEACRISEVSLYRDMYLKQKQDFVGQQGLIPGLTTEISSCAVWRGYGGPAEQGSSLWRFHGISDTLVEAQSIDAGGAPWALFPAACIDWFRLYRPVATPHLPAVPIPQPFQFGQLYNTLYSRRLGRPILLAGQQRAYLRTA